MNNCKWLSDEFTYVCCCGDNRTYCTDSCPFYERPNKRECRFYEEGKDVQRRDSVPPSWTARGYATCAGGDRIDIFREGKKTMIKLLAIIWVSALAGFLVGVLLSKGGDDE